MSFPAVEEASTNSSNPLTGMAFLRVRMRLKLIFRNRQYESGNRRSLLRACCNKHSEYYGSTFQSMGSMPCSFKYAFAREKW